MSQYGITDHLTRKIRLGKKNFRGNKPKMRNAFSEQLYIEAIKSNDVYIVVSDISPVGSMDDFIKNILKDF